MNTNRNILCLSIISIFCMIASADVINGTFNSDLSGWDFNSGVDFAGDSAVLYAPQDENLHSSVLSQHFTVEGYTTLTFSYLADVQGGTNETDHFYATLLDASYTSSESLNQSVNPGTSSIDPVPAASSLVNYGDPGQPFFYHWSSDTDESPEMISGLVTSITEDSWTTISLLLPSGLNSATIRFELIHDYTDAVTAVFVDNIRLSTETAVVPVPGALLLAGIGSFLVFSIRRKTGRQS